MQIQFAPVVLLYAVTLVLFVLLNLRGAYSRVRAAVSDYAIGPTRPLFLADGLAGGAAALLLGTCLLIGGRFPAWGALCLLAHAFFRLGVLTFPIDLEGQRLSWHGRLHYSFAIPGFAAVYLAVVALGPAAAAIIAPGFLPPLRLLALLAAASLGGVALCMFPFFRPIFGLVERVFLLSTALWLWIFSLALTVG
ncbi:MAG: DUF998 domain-containing protein [Proteobacteria bacterium]|nr:DUF998 domain-containing protein [Pseudomonadota bacterium]MBS0574667.1 DUF998 domain-containing protein [Pseudomonadota bacterium]